MEERIIKFIEEKTGESVSTDTDILTDLGLSSLEIMSLISDLEEEFDITIKSKAMKNVETIGDLVDLITKLKEN